MKALKNHVLDRGYNTEVATLEACRVMYLASCALSGERCKPIANAHEYESARLEGDKFKTLAYVRKQSIDAYAYLVEASRNLR